METKKLDLVSLKQLLKCYKVITKIMEENEMKMDNSFRRVQSWLSNAICDKLNEEELKITE